MGAKKRDKRQGEETHHPHHPHHQHHPTPSPDETCRPHSPPVHFHPVLAVVETDSIDLNVENVERCVNYGIEHVNALEGGGSFDYGSLVDLRMGPLLISASYSPTRLTGTGYGCSSASPRCR